MQPPGEAIAALLDGTHADPFALLGVHDGPEGPFARAILPGAETAVAHSLGGKKLGTLTRVDDRGLFEGQLKGKPQPVKYHCQAGGHEWWVTDPYSFGPVLGPMDDFLIAEGTHLRLFDKLGAHLIDQVAGFGFLADVSRCFGAHQQHVGIAKLALVLAAGFIRAYGLGDGHFAVHEARRILRRIDGLHHAVHHGSVAI